MSGISQIANTMATGQRRNVEKNSTAARKDHPINVMPLRVGTQVAGVAEKFGWVSRDVVTLLRAGSLPAGSSATRTLTSRRSQQSPMSNKPKLTAPAIREQANLLLSLYFLSMARSEPDCENRETRLWGIVGLPRKHEHASS